MHKERIEDLKQLEDGWFAGDGKRLNSEDMSWLEQAIDENLSEVSSFLYIYPTVDGNINLEWPFDDCEIEVELNLANKTGEVFVYGFSETEEVKILDSFTLDFKKKTEWKHLISLIKSKSKDV